MLADLAVIVPTRSRPENLRRLVKAFLSTEAFPNAALVAVIDADDPQHDEYRRVERELRDDDVSYILTRVGGGLIVYTRDEWLPLVPKLNRTAHNLVTGPWEPFAMAFMGDDHLPRTRGWVRRYLGTLYEMRTGIVYGDDGHWGEKLPTQWAMTSDIVRALGRMVPAPVEHLYCDNSILALGLAAECIRYLPEVVIEHMHPVYGKADSDDQYRRVNSKDQYRRDGDAYQRWLLTQLDADAARVRALRGVKVGG